MRLSWDWNGAFGGILVTANNPSTHTPPDTWVARWGARMPVKSACYLHIITLCGRIRVCLITWLPFSVCVCVCEAVWLRINFCLYLNECVCVCVGECKCRQTFPGHQTETLDKSVWQIYKSIKFCGQQWQSQRQRRRKVNWDETRTQLEWNWNWHQLYMLRQLISRWKQLKNVEKEREENNPLSR